MSENACFEVYSCQPMEWPVSSQNGALFQAEFTEVPEPAQMKSGFAKFLEGVKRDFMATNSHIAGKGAKFAAGALVGGSVAAKMGAKTPLSWALGRFGPLPYEFATKFGGGMSNLQWTQLSAGQRLGRVAVAQGAKMVLVTAAFEGGVLIGAVINQFLSDETKDAIGGTINEIVNEGGYKLLWEQPFGISTK